MVGPSKSFEKILKKKNGRKVMKHQLSPDVHPTGLDVNWSDDIACEPQMLFSLITIIMY